MTDAHHSAEKKTSELTELEMRDAKVPWPKTPKELTAYIEQLVDRQHDYGTCVYAMSMAATAAFQYVAHKLGVTGFQASCADLDIIRRTRSIENFTLLDWGNLLYPQYEYKFGALPKDTWEWAQKEARRLLEEKTEAHADVIAHWRSIRDGHVPFGLTLRDH